MDLLNKLSQCVQFVCYCITIWKILGLLVTASGTPPPTKVPRGAAGRGGLGREGWVHSLAVTLEGGAGSGALHSLQGPVPQDNAGPCLQRPQSLGKGTAELQTKHFCAGPLGAGVGASTAKRLRGAPLEHRRPGRGREPASAETVGHQLAPSCPPPVGKVPDRKWFRLSPL